MNLNYNPWKIKFSSSSSSSSSLSLFFIAFDLTVFYARSAIVTVTRIGIAPV